MPPVTENNGLKSQVQKLVAENNVMVFSKTTCPFCKKVKEMFKSNNVPYHAVELDKEGNGADMQNALLEITGQKTVPNVFIGSNHIGGCDDVMKTHKEGRLLSLVNASTTDNSYDYDLIVIGGGSGGLAASKEAAGFGMKVAVLDFVKPSPQGSSWGLGGTCVNVGCIPKKLMHQAAILGHDLEDSKHYGWEYADGVKHNWDKLRNGVQDHIGSLNWGYRVSLRDKKVDYHNAYAEFIGPHKIKATNRRGKVTEMTGRYFMLAMGGRPRYPDIPGAKEYAITSDDIFSLPHSPGKTLCVGASYISLENAGFLAGLGYDVTVMVRSILLRGFDQQMAEIIGDYMAKHNVKFIRETVPTKIERLEEGTPGKLRVTAKSSSGEEVVDEYNTVMVAVGRDACTHGLGLEDLGVKLNPKNGKVITNDLEQSSVPHIYAIGDILDGRPELTPVAIQAGRLLARRLFNGDKTPCDYVNVATTVFTPLEYGCIGLSEEDAISQYGGENIEVYHTNFQPLEWTVAHREENACYSKLVCLKSDNERVVGFHVAGPHAGEITQGYAVAIKLGATKADFDRTIGIHPTMSENFTTLTITKSSGVDASASGC